MPTTTALAVSGLLDRPGPADRRSDAGVIRLTARDATGLLLCAEMYGAPYDLLALALGVREDRLRGIVARWRKVGLATAWTSSGVTKSRPDNQAQALEALSSIAAPLVETPRATDGLARVARAKATM